MKVVKELIQDLDKNLDKIIPVVFMVNKQDIIEKSLSVEQVKNFIELDRMATDFSWQIVKTISYKGIGLNEALDYIVTEVLTG